MLLFFVLHCNSRCNENGKVWSWFWTTANGNFISIVPHVYIGSSTKHSQIGHYWTVFHRLQRFHSFFVRRLKWPSPGRFFFLWWFTNIEYGHTWHPMSLLRSGVIKQHKQLINRRKSKAALLPDQMFLLVILLLPNKASCFHIKINFASTGLWSIMFVCSCCDCQRNKVPFLTHEALRIFAVCLISYCKLLIRDVSFDILDFCPIHYFLKTINYQCV